MSSIFFVKFRFELQKLVGHAVSEAKTQKVVSLVQTLSSLQNTEDGAEYSTELSDQGNDNLEFGSDLMFQPPARFLVDVSLEDADLLVEETSTFSNQRGWSDYGGSADLHPSISEGNFDLEWLRGACDKIVMGSTSQLPGDELAMAICRILDSDKPGDEVDWF